ncbi:PilN domain-containing protein [Reinekea blandensis]|uniref:Uncharacterized protein n=1 Tax=Reinekea blandensis MED297 TaxID=314283 RepID=A4BG90_9GAMM|nr:PilN domain-containing protein [Reinekea blandensis]EAR08885.1 hypothetical protein MED297_04427 [Reinekea sp. MED297] [Reinekea blandensis MED297]
MTHQINLNRKHLLPGYSAVQLPTFLGVILLALLLGAGWVGAAWLEHQSLLQEASRLQTELETEQQRLTDFQRNYPNVTNEPELRSENEALTGRLMRARETYQGLAFQLENAVTGFYQPLTQLSEYDLDGLWLNQIHLQDGQRRFVLEGVARHPELIPQYLEQLGQSSFRGISIQSFTMNKQPAEDLWQFSLSNEQPANDRENR